MSSHFHPKGLNHEKAKAYLSHLKNIVFSEGTYQVEFYDPKEKQSFWPFVQIDEEGHVLDSFCTCQEAATKETCLHLSTAIYFITRKGPLHSRFKDSFWNKLCFMAFTRHGTEPAHLEKTKEKHFSCYSTARDILVSIEIRTEHGQKILDDIVFKRPKETEETSLKFSNLSEEDFALWRKGEPSNQLRYELSFWSDLAKSLMLMQEFSKPYTIDFPNAHSVLPKQALISFSDLNLEFTILRDGWPMLIPALKNVQASLKLHEFQGLQIEKIRYNPSRQELYVSTHKTKSTKKDAGTRVGDFEFIPGKGFFPLALDPALKKKVIFKEEIARFLSQNYLIVSKYLTEISIKKERMQASYNLYFDSNQTLHIVSYILEIGDLQREGAAYFLPWVYLKKLGFFLLKETVFKEIEKLIPPDEIENFIHHYRHFLSEQKGFSVHLSSVELHLLYTFDGKTLFFKSELESFQEENQVIDFINWLYIKNKGFYKKQRIRGHFKITPKTEINRVGISHFIHCNVEELEQIKGFFSPLCPIKKAGLTISLNSKGLIEVDPCYFYHLEYQNRKVEIVGLFTYVEGEGFAEIPPEGQLPEKYQKKMSIDPSYEPFFLQVELIKIKSFIISIDNKLKEPKNLHIKLEKIRFINKQWVVSLKYESEWGTETVGVVKNSLNRHSSYAMTEAGLIFFKSPRFNWLRDLSQSQVLSDGETLTFSMLDWIRLKSLETVEEPTGKHPDEIESLRLLRQIDNFETDELYQLEGLTSTLRPYQRIGVTWLWFLYTYGLSGLLCDDMGLGKTHQAMALLSAVKHAQKGKKRRYFVVCPTSVISHWEELLGRFLPAFSVFVFYGPGRNLKQFDTHMDILLTSYGTLRSDKKSLSKFQFEVAIFDEVQVAKNMQSQTHQSLVEVKALTKIGLSGTPIENRIMDLKALLDVVLPNYLPSLAQYRERFIHPIEKNKDKKKLELLKRLVNPFILRRKKSEVLDDLPEKTEEIAHCTLLDEQKELYKQAFLHSKNLVIEGIDDPSKKLPIIHIFSLLNSLKQICNHPCLVTKDFDNFENHQSGKWELFVQLLSEARQSNQKLVVFTQYLGMMTIIENFLKKNHIHYAAIRGSTRDRKKELKEFRENPECEVFVASLKAAGTGIELTAASVVIHYDRWWNPAKENQATDRVHRIGQSKGVQVFKMVTKGTIEEHIHNIIEKKMGLIEGVIGYDDKDQVKHLDREDLVALLKQLQNEYEDS